MAVLRHQLEARLTAALRRAACRWEEDPSGGLLCRCEAPSSQTQETLAGLELVRRWSARADGELLIELLDDETTVLTALAPEGVAHCRRGEN